MKTIKLSVILAGLLFAYGSAAYAATAGRVLVAVGDVTAIRNGAVIKLTRGAELQSGDTLQTGEASNMQVRFTDEGIIALRANSAYRIDDYRFENKASEDKSIFSLLKGGMRAITGAIGHFSRENYAVKATTATIGIRGTHFVLAQCSGDCFNRDGSKADDGLFGGVTDGRIAVTNQAGKQEFGKNEFFHVAALNALPQPLLAPPSFLRDQLEGQAKTKGGKPPAGTAGEGKEAASEAAGQQTVTSLPVVPPLVITAYVPNEQPPVQTAGGLVAGQILSFVSAGVDASAGINSGTNSQFGPFNYQYSWSSGWSDQLTITIVDPAQLQNAAFGPGGGINAQGIAYIMNNGAAATELGYYSNALSYSANNVNYYDTAGTLLGTVSFSYNKTASVDASANALAGNLSWGRYTETVTATVTTPGNVDSPTDTQYRHWALGDPVNFAALPTSGIYSYAWVGGTNPTDQYGAVGTMTSGGTVGVAFNSTGAQVSLSGATWNMPSGSNYSLSFSNQPVTIGQQAYSYSNPAWRESGTSTFVSPIAVPVSCTGATGACTGGPSFTAQVSGMLFGASATGLAAGIATWPNTTGGVGEHTASVQVYKR